MTIYFSNLRSIFLVMFVLTYWGTYAYAQQGQSPTHKVRGHVYSIETNQKPHAMAGASISIPTYGINTYSSNDRGSFTLGNVPAGKVNLTVSFLGKVSIDTLIDVNGDLDLNFFLKDANFKLKEIAVVATEAKAATGTSSKISRTAMDHLQPQSLVDVFSLLPGVQITNPSLSTTKQLSVRLPVSTESNFNSFGTSIIMDGAPISNNTNLQALSPAVNGAGSSLSGGASPAGGFDVRNISMDNIESIEVIRGVPGVAYGDVASGAVIVNTKAGVTPLDIRARINANLTQFSAVKGTNIGPDAGDLNLGVDYVREKKDRVQNYQFYERLTGKAVYSNVFGALRSTTSADVFYGKDVRRRNPDDEITRTQSSGTDLGFIFNTRGSIAVKDSWLRSLNYLAKVGYIHKDSHYESQLTAANAPYSMTFTDGSILSNKPGMDIYDENGNKLTNIPTQDRDKYAVYLPSTYLGSYDIDGREFNAFFRGDATFFKKIGATDNRFIVGVDFKSDKNFGDGKTFNDDLPPYRNLSMLNATFRVRRYKDIPAMTQFGAYAEDNFRYGIGDGYLNISAGLRYDAFSGKNHALSPRINASVDVVPRVLSIQGAYGKLAKAPSALYLYPEDAYFEYVNINEIGSSAIPQDQQVLMTTTRRFSTENPDLKVAVNEKFELGMRLNFAANRTLSVTAFKENLNNGYTLAYGPNTFKPLIFNEYSRVVPTQAVYRLAASNPVLAKYYTPTNNLVMKSKGVEFDLNLGRFDAINTSVALNGAWLRVQSYNKDYTYFDKYSSTGGAGRTHIGLYEKGLAKRTDQSFLTTLRTTHNIPRVGLVMTLATQVIWNESNWTSYGNDSIPVKYISKLDAKIYDFDASRKGEPEFKELLDSPNPRNYLKESYKPALSFNFNLTKEVADFMRVSFMANNMFRSYPIVESKRDPGTFIRLNNNFFFGLEMAITIK